MPETSPFSRHFTTYIVIAMLAGILFGLFLKWAPISPVIRDLFVSNVLQTGGKVFIRLITMLVIPVVFFSLVCGSANLGDLRAVGRLGLKTLLLYLMTTALAIITALFVAHLFAIGKGLSLPISAVTLKNPQLSFQEIITNIFPSNPIKAMANGNMLQVIVFAILLGLSFASLGKKTQRVKSIFEELNHVFMRLILMIMKLAPIGVFCLLSVVVAETGFSMIKSLAGYFFVVLLVLCLQFLFIYPAFLTVFARLNPFIFLKKMRAALLFAFSVSSSNASIPIMLETVEYKLGVRNSVASFVIPFGATINMDGTAIMQGVATVFIANLFHISLGLTGYLTVIGMATIASIGTAGVPGVGMITLGMVLQQVGLPIEAIGLIIAVDRLLDMARTAVNVTGDAMVSCVVAKSEGALDKSIYSAYS